MSDTTEPRPGFFHKTLDAVSNFPVRHPIAALSALVLSYSAFIYCDASFVSREIPTKQKPVIEVPGFFCRHTGYDLQGDGQLDFVCETYPVGLGEYMVSPVSSDSAVFTRLQNKYSQQQ